MIMENKNCVIEELDLVDTKMNNIIDKMIEKYGKFVSFADNSKDQYLIDLIASYNKLQEEKDYLNGQLSINE